MMDSCKTRLIVERVLHSRLKILWIVTERSSGVSFSDWVSKHVKDIIDKSDYNPSEFMLKTGLVDEIKEGKVDDAV